MYIIMLLYIYILCIKVRKYTECMPSNEVWLLDIEKDKLMTISRQRVIYWR